MKKMTGLMFTFAALLVLIFACSPFDDENDFLIESLDDGAAVRITEYIGSKQIVSIPPRIQSTVVTWIGDYAFNDKGLTRVAIPNGVTTIGIEAFARNQLNSFNIPSTVYLIMPGAFAENQISSITIPPTVVAVYGTAFALNPLTSITIGANLRLTNDWRMFFPGFFEAYRDNSSRAGTYILQDDGTWALSSR